MFEDKAVKREILDLKVKCTNFKRSCKWKGELRELEVNSITPFSLRDFPKKQHKYILKNCWLVLKWFLEKNIAFREQNEKRVSLKI